MKKLILRTIMPFLLALAPLAWGQNPDVTNYDSGGVWVAPKIRVGPTGTLAPLADGVNSIALGAAAKATGNHSAAIGHSAEVQAAGIYGVAVGNLAEVTQAYGLALGRSALANGQQSTALGAESQANSFKSVSVGPNPTIGGWSQTLWVPGDPVFEVGNGQLSTARSTAFRILKNGKVYVLGGNLSVTGSGMILINQAGDISMGGFTDGIKPGD